MSTQHTPGPWLTNESTEHCGRVNVTVCAAFTANEIATAWQGTTEVNRANASLIAAAPDLLNALVMVLDDPQALDGRPRTAEIVREAIAKAIGDK
jgi:hypothetical protein